MRVTALFCAMLPMGQIITNIDLDHLNHFGSEEALIESFRNSQGR